ncbi:MAG: CAP domain-containing protein [bacterium]
MLARLYHHFRHWFTPHHSNNFRARILHNSGLIAVIGLFLSFNLLVRLLDSTSLHILGFTSSVTIDEVVSKTNEERIAKGLSSLKYNETLADAARRKAANMFAENYWAHSSPSGIDPWHWFKEAGYKYTSAGENLAKDFGNTDRLVAAWMASESHKENILNPKYTEIGLAVVPGSLLGEDTVLVVQLFGTTSGGAVPQVAEVAVNTPETRGVAIEEAAPTPIPVQVAEVQVAPARFNEFNLKKTVAIATTVLLMIVLLFDVIIAESSKLSRRVGNNWTHLLFINAILILVTLVNAGSII